jgi:PST family polysaccharide transporter
VLRIGLQLISVIILARLLGPAQYGVVAMVTAIVGIGDTVRDFGLSSAAIQAPTLTKEQRSNLFWINTAIGLTLAVLAFSCAVPIARFYDEPRLVAITRALSATFLLNGMMTQYRASLLRALRFRAVAFIDVLSPAAALAGAITLAALGAGYWALVSQQLVQAAVALVAVVVAGRWWPRPRWHTNESLRPFFRFGGHLLGSQLVGYVANNVDSLTIGYRFGAAPLGTYNRAFQLLMNPLNQVRAPSTTVALPVLSRADDSAEFDTIVRRGQLALSLPLAVALALVVGTARPLVAALLGDQWAGVPPVLQLLAVAGLLQTLAYVGYWVYLARGLTRALMQYTLLTSVIKIACVVIGSTWGVIGVAWGYTFAHAIEWPMSLWWLSHITPMPLSDLVRGALRALGVCAVIAVAASAGTGLTSGWGTWPCLATGLAAGGAAAGALLLVPGVRRDGHDIVRAVRSAVPHRAQR